MLMVRSGRRNTVAANPARHINAAGLAVLVCGESVNPKSLNAAAQA
ncbi:hypothetical protein C4N58_004359 [Salmonella enterica subsp. enterica serovar Sandiego]|nr:hypothetical protein [Salmonella enterica subsp. enterica serovar Sandiego]EDX5730467.1 hypothetical protein [Salmonella enterica subsp. enterica serovar Sandiego]